MKVAKYYSYKNFNIIIEEKFEKKGYDVGSMMNSKWVDVVRFYLTIYNPNNKTFTTEKYRAHEYVEKYKLKWWHRWKHKTIDIRTDYDEEMKRIVDDANVWIDKRVFDHEITEGLPDSLADI